MTGATVQDKSSGERTRAPRPRTMRAAVVTRPLTLEVRDVPVPEPGPAQIRVRIQGCGVCASNIEPWEGRDWFTYPFEPGRLGHEGWGRVDAVGPEVTRFREGDGVGLLSHHAYAEYDVCDETAAVKLPAALDLVPFPAEPLGCAMNIFRRCEIEAGQIVAIVGAGFLGALLTRLAHQAGARVIAINRRVDGLSTAARMGAKHTIAMDDHWQVINKVAALTGGSGGYEVRGFCDRVIECTGQQWPLDLAAEICAVRGRLVIAGYHQDGPRQVNMQLWNWRGLDVISAHERDPAIYLRGMEKAAAAVAQGDLDPSPLYTHRYPLERLDEALNAARERPAGFIKALMIV